MMSIYDFYGVVAAFLVGSALYIILTSRHLVRIIAAFVLATAGLMVFSTLLPGDTTMPYFLIVASAIEEIIGLSLVVVYHRYRRKALLGEER